MPESLSDLAARHDETMLPAHTVHLSRLPDLALHDAIGRDCRDVRVWTPDTDPEKGEPREAGVSWSFGGDIEIFCAAWLHGRMDEVLLVHRAELPLRDVGSCTSVRDGVHSRIPRDAGEASGEALARCLASKAGRVHVDEIGIFERRAAGLRLVFRAGPVLRAVIDANDEHAFPDGMLRGDSGADADFAAWLALDMQTTYAEALAAVLVLARRVARELLAGRRAHVNGVGTFVVTVRPASATTNPQTGERVAIGERRILSFEAEK